MIQQVAVVFLALSFALQFIILALALRLALARGTLRQLPAWWAWVLTAIGLIVMLARWGMNLPKAFSETQIADSLVSVFTSTCLTIAVTALFRRLTSAEALSCRRSDELIAVQRVGAASTSARKLNEVLHQVYEQVRQVIPLDAFCLALYDRVTDDLRLELIIEQDQVQTPFTIKATDCKGLTGRVVRSRQVLRIDDLEAQKRSQAKAPWQASQPPIRSWLGLPLIVQDRTVGALSVQSYRASAFTDDHYRLLETIAAQAAIAIENARLAHDLQAIRERYRTLIENAQEAILIETEDDEILDANTAACQLLGYSREELLRLRVQDLQVPEVVGPAGSIVKSDLARAERVFESVNLRRDGTRVPVQVSIARIAGENERLAFATLRDITERKHAEQALRESETRYQMLLAATRRQAQELELLNQVRTAVTRELDLPALFRTVVEAIANTFGYRLVGIYRLQGDTLDLEHQVGFEKVIQHIPINTGVNGRVARTGRPELVQDVRADPDYLPATDGAISEVCVPLLDDGKVVGTLNVETTSDMLLTQDDLRMMMALSEHIGIAIAKARLFSSLAEEKGRAELLYVLAQQLASSLDVRRVAQEAIDSICTVTGASAGVIYVHELALDGGAGLLRLETIARKGPGAADALNFRLRVGEGLTGWVAANRQPALADDVRQDERWATVTQTDEWIRSVLSVPLLSGDELIGVLTLGSDRVRYFSPDHLRLVESAAASITVAMVNARLYQETGRALARLQALGQINRAVSSSLEIGQVLATIARHAAELSQSDAAGIFELDETQQMLTVSASHNADPAFIQAVNEARVRVGQGAIGQAVATRRPVAIVDTQSASSYPFGALAALGDYRSVMAVPMLGSDHLIGGIVIWRKQAEPFVSDEVELLAMLADQSVVAIENARLYRAATRRLQEVSLIQSVALAGATGWPFDEIVARATDQLRALWDSHHLGFLFPDETGVLRVHPSYYGMPDELKQTWGLRPGEGLGGWVFQTGKPVVVPDVRQDPRYFELIPETLSEMDAPLFAGDDVIGVVNVESMRLNAFSDDDLHLLSALAGQLAIILDNVQARRALAERAQQLQDAYSELAAAEQVKDQLTQNISHELRMPMTYIKGYTDLILDGGFGSLPDTLRAPLTIVNEKTDTVTQLIERIVALQTISTSKLHLELVSIGDLVREQAERWQLDARKAGIGTVLDVSDDLPVAAGDRKLLREALDCLLSNALKFSPRGGQITLSARGEEEMIHVRITDHGIGISNDKLTRVFDRFYQVDGSATRRFGGTGVGLALVKQIVHAHGGRVWAESPGEGLGSTFHVVLPIAPVGAS